MDWLSQEYVACVIGPLASRGTHYVQEEKKKINAVNLKIYAK